MHRMLTTLRPSMSMPIHSDVPAPSCNGALEPLKVACASCNLR